MAGYILALLSFAVWGIYPILVHYFISSLNPLLFSGLATFITALPYLLVLFFKGKILDVVDRKYILFYLSMGFFAAMGSIFLFIGTGFTSGINTGLLLQIEPVYTLILGLLFLGEQPNRNIIFAIFIMIIGAMVIVYKGNAIVNIGDMYILLAPLCYQISHMIAKKMFTQKMSYTQILGSRQFYQALWTIGIYLVFSYKTYPDIKVMNNISPIVILGVAGFIEISLWYGAIKRLALSKASALQPTSAIFSLLAAVLFLKESVTLQHFLGFALIVCGFFVYSHHFEIRLTKRR